MESTLGWLWGHGGCLGECLGEFFFVLVMHAAVVKTAVGMWCFQQGRDDGAELEVTAVAARRKA